MKVATFRSLMMTGALTLQRLGLGVDVTIEPVTWFAMGIRNCNDDEELIVDAIYNRVTR